jgi:hypothetical protein
MAPFFPTMPSRMAVVCVLREWLWTRVTDTTTRVTCRHAWIHPLVSLLSSLDEIVRLLASTPDTRTRLAICDALDPPWLDTLAPSFPYVTIESNDIYGMLALAIPGQVDADDDRLVQSVCGARRVLRMAGPVVPMAIASALDYELAGLIDAAHDPFLQHHALDALAILTPMVDSTLLLLHSITIDTMYRLTPPALDMVVWGLERLSPNSAWFFDTLHLLSPMHVQCAYKGVIWCGHQSLPSRHHPDVGGGAIRLQPCHRPVVFHLDVQERMICAALRDMVDHDHLALPLVVWDARAWRDDIVRPFLQGIDRVAARLLTHDVPPNDLWTLLVWIPRPGLADGVAEHARRTDSPGAWAALCRLPRYAHAVRQRIARRMDPDAVSFICALLINHNVSTQISPPHLDPYWSLLPLVDQRHLAALDMDHETRVAVALNTDPRTLGMYCHGLANEGDCYDTLGDLLTLCPTWVLNDSLVPDVIDLLSNLHHIKVAYERLSVLRRLLPRLLVAVFPETVIEKAIATVAQSDSIVGKARTRWGLV